MSIFKSTFSSFVRDQLARRQSLMTNRTTQGLQYLNSRNAWVRLSSSVNVGGDNELAKDYILQGGTLNIEENPQSEKSKYNLEGKLKTGIGNTHKNSYSTRPPKTVNIIGANNELSQGFGTEYSFRKYTRGIRPMPGITSVNIKSKSAYGSLREAVVSFQCWDIEQLEDLEVLYMRPGYTVLLEWGWAPYIDNKGNYKSNFTDYYDIINVSNINRTQIFDDLYKKCQNYSGNYDALFGYVKNYSWSARPDGGYDCQTTIISTGEIIESLKINYHLANTDKVASREKGLLTEEFIIKQRQVQTNPKWVEYYKKENILAALWAELYYKATDFENYTISETYKSDIVPVSFSGSLIAEQNAGSSNRGLSDNYGTQVYVSLDKVFNLLENKIIAKDNNAIPLINLSLDANTYDATGITGSLLCVAHPLQVSVDPTVCAINNPIWWEQGGTFSKISSSLSQNTDLQIAKAIYEGGIKPVWQNNIGLDLLVAAIKKITKKEILTLVDYYIESDTTDEEKYKNLQEVLQKELSAGDVIPLILIEEALTKISDVKVSFNLEVKTTTRIADQTQTSLSTINNTDASYFVIKTQILSAGSPSYTEDFGPSTQILIGKNDEGLSIITITYPSEGVGSDIETIATSAEALGQLSYLAFLKPYFYQENRLSGLGVIKNIYINVNYLYQKAIDYNIEASDKKEKNEISLYTYLKRIIYDVQLSIGNINNFEIHVDPVDNTARIIDVNYTEAQTANNLFELQIHDLRSVVRSYTLQSQIFPEQSAIIAIGAQVKGGPLGIQTNTLIDFNRGLTDRIITEKLEGSGKDTIEIKDNKLTTLNGLANIIRAFNALVQGVDPNRSVDINSLFADAKNSLRDLITYIQSLTIGNNRNIIPTKFSFETDGIGGLVIGHMFKLPKNVLPRGYRGEGLGSELGQVVTGISHEMSGGNWTTKVDTLNIVLQTFTNNILELNSGRVKYSDDLLLQQVVEEVTTVTRSTPTPTPTSNEVSSTQTNAELLERYLLENNIATVKPRQLDNGGDIQPETKDVASAIFLTIKRTLPEVNIFITAGNDLYHRRGKPILEFNAAGESRLVGYESKDLSKTLHDDGLAIDFVITPEPPLERIIKLASGKDKKIYYTQEQPFFSPSQRKNFNNAIVIENLLKSYKEEGLLDSYINEYFFPSKDATGGHFHFVVKKRS